MSNAAQREARTGMITLGLSDKPDAGQESNSTEDGPRALTLTNLMLAWSFVVPFSGAMGFSKAAKCGTHGFVVAMLIGLPIGLIFAYAMWQGFHLVFSRLGKSESIWISVLILLAGFVWIAIGGWTGSLAEEAFFPKQSAYLKACRATHTCLTPQTSEQH